MKDKILEYLILGGFGVCGLLIGYFSTGYHEYKKYSKELESLLNQTNDEIDKFMKVSDDSISVRDETIECLIKLLRLENPELGKEIEKNFRKTDFTVVENEET